MGAALIKKTCPRCGRAFDADAAFCPNDGAPLEPDRDSDPESDPYIGALLPGDIEIRSVAGVGAMGRVYRAHQRGIDRDVAVKILHRELSGNLPLVQRFHREAKIASKLQHPHVVDVYLAGQLPDGALYIVMEYLDGMSLSTALGESGGAFGLQRSIPIALQICDAVGEGHARGIVHRDLKPENVMLVHRADTSDWVKVLDFGIAKVSIGEQSMETAAGLIFGTARYISPEGAQGSTVGPAGDVYAIATILYQLLAGRTPFDAEQPVGLLIKHLHEVPPPLASWPSAADVPEPIVRVVMDNLAKDPGRRAPTARALGNALAAAAKEANVAFSDIGVVARMSMLDAPRARLVSGESAAVRAAPPVRVVTSNTPISTRDAAAEQLDVTYLEQPRPKEVSSPPQSPQAGSGPGGTLAIPAVAPPPKFDLEDDNVTDAPSSRSPRRKEKKRSTLGIVLLAFLLGAAIAALVMQQLVHRKDAEHAEHVARARRALLEERYVSPPNDNVRDITAAGLERWPDDTDLARVRAEAAQALVTRAMAARSSGDLTSAQELAETAVDFEPTDRAAMILLDQYQDELRLSADGNGPSHVVLKVPEGRARPGARAALVATMSIGGAPPKDAVNNPRFTVTGPGLTVKGTVLPASSETPGVFTASVVPPREGAYHVVFEASSAGVPFRAERNLAVAH